MCRQREEDYRVPLPTALVGVDKEIAETNYMVILMARNGFSTEAISQHTGLTCSQVQHRIGKYGLRGYRLHFRRGVTLESKRLLATILDVPDKRKKQEMAYYDRVAKNVIRAFQEHKIKS